MSLPSTTAIHLDNVAVRYRVPMERISSFKEFAIKKLKGLVDYREHWALRDISLDIPKGQAVGILGANGAGKSTLLKLLARVLPPTTGRVLVRGRVAPLLELGAGFDTELTGHENILLNGVVLGFKKEVLLKRMQAIIDFSGLGDFIDAPVKTYSSGMVARLGFSIATDMPVDLLLLDEILSIGDAAFQEKSIKRIQAFRDRKATIIYVSHSLESIATLCDHAIWLDAGKIAHTGSPPEVIEAYLKKTA